MKNEIVSDFSHIFEQYVNRLKKYVNNYSTV